MYSAKESIDNQSFRLDVGTEVILDIFSSNIATGFGTFNSRNETVTCNADRILMHLRSARDWTLLISMAAQW